MTGQIVSCVDSVMLFCVSVLATFMNK